MKVERLFTRGACISPHIDTRMSECVEQIVIAVSCAFVALVLKINSHGRKWFKIGGNCAESGADLIDNLPLEKSSLYHWVLLGTVNLYGTLRSAQS